MNRTRLRILAAATSLTAALTMLAAIPAAASAAPGGAAIDPAAQFLKQKYQITDAEAEARLAQQDRATRLLDDLELRFGDGYGGMWIDQTLGGAVVVGVVRPHQVAVVRALAAGRQVTRLRTVPVTRTVGQLRAVQAQVKQALAKTPHTALRLGGVHLPTNQVTVKVQAGDVVSQAQAFAEAEKLAAGHPGQLRLVAVTGVPMTAACIFSGEFNVFCDAPLRGGVGITASSTRCSGAFNVRSKSDSKYYLLSAGHCDDAGTWQTRFEDFSIHDIGPTHNAIWNATADAMIIRVNHPEPDRWNPKPWVFVTGDDGTTYDETYDINGSGLTSIGMAVCMTGRRDGTQCGEVIDNDVPGVLVSHVAEVSGGCIRGGDSGGAVYKLHTAYGIVHAGTFPGGNNDVCSITWFYQGVRGAMDELNVRLITTSNP